MTSFDTLKQAAQALRDTKPELAAALEAMAEQKPVAKVARGHYGNRMGNIGYQYAQLLDDVFVMDGDLLYAVPIATPEHDAKVRDAALEEAAKVCEDGAAEAADHRVEFACDILSDRIRDLKATGADHAK